MKKGYLVGFTLFFIMVSFQINTPANIDTNILGTWSYSSYHTYIYDFKSDSTYILKEYAFGVVEIKNGNWSSSNSNLTLSEKGTNQSFVYYYSINYEGDVATITPITGGESISLVKGSIVIPSTDLSMESTRGILTVNGKGLELGIEAHPSNTTDTIRVISRDDQIVKVSNDARIIPGRAGGYWTFSPSSRGEVVVDITCGSKKIEQAFKVALLKCDISNITITPDGGVSYTISNNGDITTDSVISFNIKFEDNSDYLYYCYSFDLDPGSSKTEYFSFGKKIISVSLNTIENFDSYYH